MRGMFKAAGAAVLLSLGWSSIAAAVPGYATGDVNLRAGPGTEYPVVTVLNEGTGIEIYGCLSGYSWCDVYWGGYRGWVSSHYIEALYEDRRVYVREVGVPIISFSFGYWDDHYRGRSWYRDRDRYFDYDRYDRREARRDRREFRREVRREFRQDRREDRREARRDRREDRREARRDRRPDRQAVVRRERREARQERRADRREIRRDRRQDRRQVIRRDRREDRREVRRDRRQDRREMVRQDRRQERRADRRERRGNRNCDNNRNCR